MKKFVLPLAFHPPKGLLKVLLCMKLSFLIVLLAAMQVSAKVYSQNDVKLTMTLQGVKLGKALALIERKTDFRFLYNNANVPTDKRVDIQAENTPLPDILAQALANTGLHYKVLENKMIVIAPDAMMVQDITVKGTVTDEKGTPVPGATVKLLGGNIGTTTDAGGNYSIEVPDNGTLVFSFVGYEEQQIPVNSKNNISVRLKTSSTGLNEVVVVGYGTQRKADLTGAVATVSGAELNKRVVTNPVSLLQGKLPGLELVQNSGEPGNENISLQIRGMGTYSGAGNNPLVIIDGIPGSLSALDPQNIASITLLKDAASAAIYGARAANGVILVTTKTGNNGGFHLEYDYNIGITTPTALPRLVTNSVQYMQLYDSAAVHTGMNPPYTQAMIDAYTNPSNKKLYPNTDWLGLMFHTAYVQTHYLGLSGGKNGTTYNVGLGYVYEPGVMMGFDYKKYNLQFNLNSVINSHISFGSSLTLNYGDRLYPRQGSSDQFLSTLAQAPMYGPVLPDGSGKYTYSSYAFQSHNKNPVAIAQNVRDEDKNYYMQGNAFVNVRIVDGLDWKTSGGLNFTYDNVYDFRPVIPQYNWFTGAYVTNLNVGGQGLNVSDYNSVYPVIYSQLTYDKTFGENNIKILAGAQEEYFKEQWLSGFRLNFPNNTIPQLNAGGTDGQSTSGTADEWALRSFYGRFNYDYKDKYLFEANARYDGSSRFADANRWGLFPSFSAGWRISKESFMRDISWINDLKLRGSWGRLGNQNIGLYPYQDILSLGYDYPFDYSTLSSGAVPTNLVDKNIKWETTQITDFGIDFTTFNGSLTFTADWFRKETYDILRSAQIPGYIGLGAPTINGGEMRNTGYEFSAQYSNHVGQFRYSLGGNFQSYKNTLVKYGQPSIGGTTINMEGKPWGTYYLYDWIGIFQSAGDVAKSPTQPFSPQPGDLKFKDVNGDGVINASDRTFFSGAFPKFDYSFNMNAEWKNFDLTAFFYGSEGRKVYVTGWGIEPFSQGSVPTTNWLHSWTPANPTNALPHIYIQGAYPAIDNVASSYFLKDASFLRLKNLQIGYNIPVWLLGKIGITGLRVYFAGDNLLTFSQYPGLDPERISSGRYVNYPQNKIYSFGVKVKF